MAVFDVRVSFVGTSDAPTPAIVSIAEGELAMEVAGKEIGRWPIFALSPARSGNSFLITAEGESLALEVDDPDAFGQSLGLAATPDIGDAVDVEQSLLSEADVDPVEPERQRERHVARVASGSVAWWKFWSGQAWRDWMAKRGPWREYRNQTGPVETEIKSVRKSLRDNEAALKTAQQELRWAAELSPRDLPIKTWRNETGLGTVAGVSLKEIRKKDGKETWTVVDAGSVFVTDRRLMFSGKKNVEFKYEKISKKGKAASGLLIGVSSRKRDHVLAGPVDQLAVVLAAGEAASESGDPTAPFAPKVSELKSSMAAEQHRLDALTVEKELIPVPTRPISPAWIPVVLLLVLIGFAGGTQESDADRERALAALPASTTATATTMLDSTTTPAETTTVPDTSPSETQQPVTEEEVGIPSALIAAAFAGASGDPIAAAPDGSTQVKVVSITDGDTLDVRLPDGTVDTVRLIGINSPEQGECFADIATMALTALATPSSEVSLTSDVSDRDQFDRLLRYVWVGGMSVNEELVRRGVAIARRYPPDTSLADRFEGAQDDAEASDIGLWAPDACGTPVDAALRITLLNYDAPGNDNENLNEEWIRIENAGRVVADLTDWTIRDESASNRYTFPVGFTLASGEAVTVHTGCGTDFGTDLFWCSVGSAVWNNNGDTAFLGDPRGNIHHSWSYAPETTTTTTTTTTRATTTSAPSSCHPSYTGACVPIGVSDVDCRGGSGNGPYYVGRVTVVGPDVYGLDRDGDGIGCESS